MRVSAFVDGFNLYHAIRDLNLPHLKWVDLRKLCERYSRPAINQLARTYHFTAYLDRVPDYAIVHPGFRSHIVESHRRHRLYEDTLRAVGVEPVISYFKFREAVCPYCRKTFHRPEEKQTDVSIAMYLFAKAVEDEYDIALIVSADSDLVPALKITRRHFPDKRFWIVTPPGRTYNDELYAAAGDTWKKVIKVRHLEESLLDNEVRNAEGDLVGSCPPEWLRSDRPASNRPSVPTRSSTSL